MRNRAHCRLCVGSARYVVAASASIALVSNAHALDLGQENGLITETIASRDRRAHYDASKSYGAEAVSDRSRAYASPKGLRAGNFLVLPSLGETVVFDDNIYATDANKRSDVRFETAPSVRVKSALPRHELDFSLDGRIVNFAEHTEQDYASVRAKLDAALHFDHAHTLAVSVLSALDHEEPGDISAPLGAAEPTPVVRNQVSVGLTRDAGRLYGTLAASVSRWDFSNVRDNSGNTLDQDVRDTDQLSAYLRMGYRISPGFELIGKLRGVVDDNRGDGTLDADARGYEAMAGLAFETSPLVRWRVLGGYGIRDFDSKALDDVATVIAEGHVQWLATQSLTISGIAKREIVAADGLTTAGRVETRVGASADYEIWHNVVLKAGAEWSNVEFVGSSREDRNLTGHLGVEYYANENWLLTLKYEHVERDSSDPAFDMTRNRVMFGGKLRF